MNVLGVAGRRRGRGRGSSPRLRETAHPCQDSGSPRHAASARVFRILSSSIPPQPPWPSSGASGCGTAQCKHTKSDRTLRTQGVAEAQITPSRRSPLPGHVKTWSKHGSSIIPHDLHDPCWKLNNYARTMFTPTVFSHRRPPAALRAPAGAATARAAAGSGPL